MIVITTPTGKIGAQVLRELLAKDISPLRVLVRDARKLSEAVRARVETVEGDLHQPASLSKAFGGASTLFWCQPDCPDAPDYVGAYEALATTARDAIRASGVSRVVAISAAGSPGNRPAGPITALHRMEAALRESGAACRFLRGGSFYENLLWQWESILHEGVFVYSMPGDTPTPQVATKDIAAVAARWLADADWVGSEAVSLLGPRDLSFNAVATELTQALGRPVRYEAMSPHSYRDILMSMGQSEDAAQGLVDMFEYLAVAYHPDERDDRALTPTTLAQWIQSAARSA
ncbi:MAG: NAD(P)H-binding protein [Bryobacterales bacterium]|nr:NAD(P)H-binding protein [Bryobacterales bacterium]